jgi:hypothetical protein
VWLIDPKQRTVYVADVDGLHEVSDARVTLKAVGGTTTIDFNEIFAELD